MTEPTRLQIYEHALYRKHLGIMAMPNKIYLLQKRLALEADKKGITFFEMLSISGAFLTKHKVADYLR